MSTSQAAQYPYQDSSVPTDRRVEDLLSRMTLQDKAGLMFQPLAPMTMDLEEQGMFNSPSLRAILDSRINHVNILQGSTAREIAQWHNLIQREALKTPLGIPFTVSSDPRHSFSDNPAAALIAGPFSQWPEPLGFGALDDPELTERFADTVRREYLATGIRLALHPQIDLATDPRWARASGTFGESANVAGRLGAAYVRGLRGDGGSTKSVSSMVKHFPGGGPQLDGEDPHFEYGREQVYPGGQFDLHLQPFLDVFAAGATQVMPYYGMPVGTEYEEVGFSFNKGIVTGLLREKLGFDGIVCTDWGILSRTFWGVEHLSVEERMVKALDAGVDQFGGDSEPSILVKLVNSGAVAEARLDVSVRRLLREKFELGLFDDARFVDVDAADALVGAADALEAGLAAQMAAHVVLKNAEGVAHLPLSGQPKLYVEGVDPQTFTGWAHIVPSPDEADVAIIRTVAPWEQRGKPGELESFFHAGSLEFHDAELEHLRDIARRVPTIVDVYLDRPAILAPVADVASALTVNFGASAEAFAAILFGASQPKGKLPFDIPSSMAAVEASRPDVPFDTAEPTYRFGDGLRFDAWAPAERPDLSSTSIRMN
ncbi:glycoside hydrolase family 3 protein [Agromyces albus]|uniref:beta-glucosidase n=1 Tax=Agromyces albus TaxID=205332 RepID=A0A4Q2KW59_9MICO|nr:glycoside hydrolase family 3 N-terminal domain-containing protein [Agromyces albus]RXZ68062.1 glycoside hydrolase family 3 protein [Agromyces albus]